MLRSTPTVKSRTLNNMGYSETEPDDQSEIAPDKDLADKEPSMAMMALTADKETYPVETLFSGVTLDDNGTGLS